MKAIAVALVCLAVFGCANRHRYRVCVRWPDKQVSCSRPMPYREAEVFANDTRVMWQANRVKVEVSVRREN